MTVRGLLSGERSFLFFSFFSEAGSVQYMVCIVVIGVPCYLKRCHDFEEEGLGGLVLADFRCVSCVRLLAAENKFQCAVARHVIQTGAHPTRRDSGKMTYPLFLAVPICPVRMTHVS